MSDIQSSNLISFSPNSTSQKEFFESTEDEILFGGSSGGGKRCNINELAPTPEGWKTVGSICVGDKIFSELGDITIVTHVHPIDISPESYLLKFDDGTEIKACADHQWLTFNAKELHGLTTRTDEWRKARRERRPSRATGNHGAYKTKYLTERNKNNPPPTLPLPTGSVRTTKEIANTLTVGKRKRNNHAIPVAKAIKLPEKNFLIEPYLLGLWIGDGYAATGQIGKLESDWVDILLHVKRPVVKTSIAPMIPPRTKRFATLKFDGLRQDLKYLGLIDNKHIPQDYLRGSIEQRLELLRGLMDTDGTASTDGKVSFTNTNKRIIDGIQELICSLGWKCGIAEGRAKLYGKDYGPVWDVRFTATEKVFHLPRRGDRQTLATRQTTKFRYVVSCERIDSIPMRCISVDNPTHLWLVGKSFLPTHNSVALVIDPLKYKDYADFTAIIFRRSFPELEPLINYARKYYTAAGGDYHVQSKTWTFGSGAKIKFGFMDAEGDWVNYQGHQYAGMYFDELTNILWSNFEGIRPWNRSMAMGIKRYLRAASNPGGSSHGYVKEYFVDKCPAVKDGEMIFSKEVKMWWQPMKAGAPYYDINPIDGSYTTRKYIPSRVFQNIDLLKMNPSYVSDLLRQEERKRKAYLEGDWDIFEGQFFVMSKDVHSVPPDPDDFDYTGYRIIAGLDYGSRTVLEVCRMDDKGFVTCFAERFIDHIVPSQSAEMVAEELLERRLHNIPLRYDTNMAADTSKYTGYDKTPLAIFRQVLKKKMGAKMPTLIPVSKTSPDKRNYRQFANEAVKEYLYYEKRADGSFAIHPRLKISQDCTHLWDTMPKLMHDPNRNAGLDFNRKIGISDPYDGMKYSFLGLYVPIRVEEVRQKTEHEKVMEYIASKQKKSQINSGARKSFINY